MTESTGATATLVNPPLPDAGQERRDLGSGSAAERWGWSGSSGETSHEEMSPGRCPRGKCSMERAGTGTAGRAGSDELPAALG